MKKITITLPDGYQPPEGTEDGQSFDESVTFRIKDGKLTLTAINGVMLDPKEGGEKASPEPPAPDEVEMDLAARYEAAMQQSQA